MMMSEWKKPEIIVVNLKDYEEAILANANSGGGGGGSGFCWAKGCSQLWN